MTYRTRGGLNCRDKDSNRALLERSEHGWTVARCRACAPREAGGRLALGVLTCLSDRPLHWGWDTRSSALTIGPNSYVLRDAGRRAITQYPTCPK